jgi:hypothetical protein
VTEQRQSREQCKQIPWHREIIILDWRRFGRKFWIFRRSLPIIPISGTSGAKSPLKVGLIAALKALRHPKAIFRHLFFGIAPLNVIFCHL